MSRKTMLLPALATLLLGLLAISGQSLWIDEGGAAMKAVQPTLPAFWNALFSEHNSNLQLLLHLSYLWAWVKVFGASEIALRAANLPFIFLGLAGAVWGLQRQPARQFWFVVLASVNAFTWYYANEARPYMLLFAASSWALACVVRAYHDPRQCAGDRSWFLIFCTSLFVVAATSLVAVPWVAAWIAATILLLGWGTAWSVARKHLLVGVLWLISMGILGAYYFWTLRIGAKPSDVGRTGFANLFYIFYEQLGLAGLGPGRTDLRAGGIVALRPYTLLLALGVGALLIPTGQLLLAIAERFRNQRQLVLLALATVLPLVAVLGAGWLTDARILGRHLTPLYPSVLFGMAISVERLLAIKTRTRMAAAAALVLVLGFSALQIRFAPRHARDAYRTAATIAKGEAAAGNIVWWAADFSTAAYYAVRFVESDATSGIIPLLNPTPEQLAALPSPAMIVLSKPDIHDRKGAVEIFAADHGLRTTRRPAAFHILEPRS